MALPFRRCFDWRCMKGAPSLTKADYEKLAAFRYALRQFLRFSEEAAHAAGVTPQQHQALLAIKGFPGRDWVTMSELAERLQVQHHSAVGLVDRLVEEKLLTRKPSPADRREVHLHLTARGERLLACLVTTHRAQLTKISPHIKLLLDHLNPGGGAE
jgi:DNA-binding MarR family transcriptional regulator